MMWYSSLEFMKRELKFMGIEGLKYYPSPETAGVLSSLVIDADKDIRVAVKRAQKALLKDI